MLGEAYAFGVVWSFAMKALSVLVLRYKQPGGREWKVPLNFHIGRTEIPLGLMMITVSLFALAIINVLTKKVATISGVSFHHRLLHRFRALRYLQPQAQSHSRHRKWKNSAWTRAPIFPQRAISVRPGNVLVAVRNPHRLQHLARILARPIRARWISWCFRCAR